ncbi:MAG: hypothetical protein H6748_07185 [Spirochaetaceae bacterium]|nr:hypothetical protein [Myxococcales bacterium]MCB9723809.1 hypothetical protein [Spirochaetaceae bacterium]
MTNAAANVDNERPNVFIHTNHRQMLGAIVSRYSMKRNSAEPDAFDVHLIDHADFPFFEEYEGREYLRDGAPRVWRNEDLQSFTPLRFMPPELMGYRGRAVVTDPDVFAVGDVLELLRRDMQGNAIMCRPRSGAKRLEGVLATSVMLLDCAQLTHWNVRQQFDSLFQFSFDYADWIGLKKEDRSKIGLFENEWNDFDRLTEKTKLIHNTKRKTQPWKAGLPADFIPAEKYRVFPPIRWVLRARRKLFGDYAFVGPYKTHPDPNQEAFFFGLLRECVDQRIVSEDFIRQEMARNHVRHDAFEVLDRVRPLAAA